MLAMTLGSRPLGEYPAGHPAGCGRPPTCLPAGCYGWA